jgi:epoxyqueuosine reductase
LLRNALIAAGNSGDKSLIPAVEHLLTDASPLVRAMAVWALRRLAPASTWEKAKRTNAFGEADAAVLAEWT